MNETTELRPARFMGLTRHTTAFVDPAVPVGEWHRPTSAPGCIAAASFVLSDEAARFVADCYEYGWVLGGFDWAAWAQTPEARRLRDDPIALARASEQQLAQLLTVVIRQQRFVEGALSGAVASGLIPGILRRAGVLGGAVGPSDR